MHHHRALHRRYGHATRRSVDDQIWDIRLAAGNPGTHCPTCTQPVDRPYRSIHGGKIVQGCIDACHRPHIHGESLKWHMQPAAVERRKRELAHLKSL